MITNTFTNLRSPYVQSETDIPSVLHQIQIGQYKDKIIEARAYGKGHESFEKIKAQIPTFSPNGCFNEIRRSANIKSLSGFIYLDIDDYSDLEVFYKLPFIHSFWKSVSGNGLGVLVSVSGLTVESFKHSWTYLNDHFQQLNITVDPHTKDVARQCVISYDPELYINPDPISLIIPDPGYETSTSTSTYANTLSEKYYSTSTGTEKINYKTTLDDYNGLDYIVIAEGREYRAAYLPKIINEGQRHKWISSFILTLLFNNPTISYERLFAEAEKANLCHCNPVLRVEEVVSMTKWCYEKHIERRLTIHTRRKKIWFNPEAKLTAKEKQTISGKETGKLRTQRTIDELVQLYLLLQGTDQRVTQKKLEAQSTKSIRTIKKYWKEILEKVHYGQKKKKRIFASIVHLFNKNCPKDLFF